VAIAGRVDRVRMGMMARLRDLRRDVVDRDDAVEQHHDHEDQQTKRKIIQKRIADDRNLTSSASWKTKIK
jgi:hypothetical protein